MKALTLFLAGITSSLLISGCVTPPAKQSGSVIGHAEAPRYGSPVVCGHAGHPGEVTTKSNGVSSSPVYQTGTPGATGYVKVYFSKTVPTPPKTTWYLDGASKGTVTATGTFRVASRTGHTVSFTCLGNNKPPQAVGIDLAPYQKVRIPIYYQ